MARKMTGWVVFLLLASASWSSASTVGGTRKINETVESVPAGGSTLTCNAVKLTTNTMTAVLTAHADRLAFWIINRSTTSHCSGCATNDDRPSFVAISTGSTINSVITAAGNQRSNFSNLNAKVLSPCFSTRATGVTEGGDCRFGMLGGSIYTGAFYGIAESSGTTSTNVFGVVEACELR